MRFTVKNQPQALIISNFRQTHTTPTHFLYWFAAQICGSIESLAGGCLPVGELEALGCYNGIGECKGICLELNHVGLQIS